MMEEQLIRSFLMEQYGYAKIEAWVRGQKPSEMRPRDFFAGTIVGTFKPEAYDSDTQNTKRSFLPRVSKIRRYEEIEHPLDEDIAFAHHLTNRSFLHKMNRDKVKSFLDDKLKEAFGQRIPETRLETVSSRGWKLETKATNIRVFAKGSTAANELLLYVDFDASIELKKELNDIVRRYYVKIAALEKEYRIRL
ncbi:MAG: hypothetical protein AABX10_03400 [Nanoarchaeota archaeon]